ncbi:hypothetical protein ABK040_004069 [Willaertia magna]
MAFKCCPFSIRYWLFTLYPSNFLYVPCLWIVLPLLLFGSAVLVGLLAGRSIPIAQPSTVPNYQFSEERARIHLNELSGYYDDNDNYKGLGNRVGGSINNILARDYLVNQTSYLSSLQNDPTIPYRIEISTQPFQRYTNIIVRVSLKNLTGSPDDYYSFLLSSHYDSVEYSKGGSNDASGVATMIELLNNIVHTPIDKGPKYPVIFHFNDGEEAGLLGAQAFMEHHPWSKKCLRFINIDSTGNAGKALVFRVTDDSVLHEYSGVPYPYINVIGEEMLKLIPTYSTDFSVYGSSENQQNRTNQDSKYGTKYNLKGFDYTFYWDGYAHETFLDTNLMVEKGSLQHLGSNVLHQVLSVTRDDSIMSSTPTTTSETDTSTNEVYFDVLGGFFVHYSTTVSDVIQAIIVVVDLVLPIVLVIIDHIISLRYYDTSSIYQLFRKATTGLQARIMFLILYVIGYILSLGIGITIAVIIGAVVDSIQPMAWYRDPLLAIFLFGMPTMFGIILVNLAVHLIGNSSMRCCGCFRLYRVSLKDKNELQPDESTASQILLYALDKERYLALTFFWGLLTAASLITRLRSFYIVYFWSFCLSGVLIVLLVCDRVIVWCYLIFTNKTRSKALEAMGVNETELSEAGDDAEKRKRALFERRKKREGENSSELTKDDEKYLQKESKKRRLRHEITVKIRNFSWKDFCHALIYHQLHWIIFMAIASWAPLVVTIDVFDRLIHFVVPITARAEIPLSGTMIAAIVGLFFFLMTVSYIPILHRAANFTKLLIVFGGISALVIIIALARSGFTHDRPRKIGFKQLTKVGSSVVNEIDANPFTVSLSGLSTVSILKSGSTSQFSLESYDGVSISPVLKSYKTLLNVPTNSAFRREVCEKYTKCSFLVNEDQFQVSMNQFKVESYNRGVHNVGGVAMNHIDATVRLSLSDKIVQSQITIEANNEVQNLDFILNENDPNGFNRAYAKEIVTVNKKTNIIKFGMNHMYSLMDISFDVSDALYNSTSLTLTVDLYKCDFDSTTKVLSDFYKLYQDNTQYITPLGSGTCSTYTERAVFELRK